MKEYIAYPDRPEDMSHKEFSDLCLRLANRGVSAQHLRNILKYDTFAEKISSALTDWDLFYGTVMGPYYFGVRDWERIFGIKVKPDAPPWDEPQLSQPCPIDTVTNLVPLDCMKAKIMHTHLLFFWPPEDAVRKVLNGQEIFIKSGWYLVYLDETPGTMRQPWERQLALIPKGYQLASAGEVIAARKLFFAKTVPPKQNIRFPANRLRCADPASGCGKYATVVRGEIEYQDDQGLSSSPGIAIKRNFPEPVPDIQ